MTGTRRASEPAPLFRFRRQPPKGNVTVIAAEKPQADTQVIMRAAPAATEVITPAAPPAPPAAPAPARVPVPDRHSADPADRTLYLQQAGDTEPVFEAVVADLDAMWLLDTTLPAPPHRGGTESEEVADGRRRLSDTTDPGPGDVPPPAGAPTAPVAPGPGRSEDEPVQDEPDAEADCGEGAES